MRSGRTAAATAAITAWVGGIVLTSFLATPALAAEDQGGKIKTLLLVGGEIHDWKRIGDVVESAMKKTGKFDVTRVDNDLNAFLADRVAPYDLVVFYWTLGKLTDAQKKGILDHIAKGKGFVTFHSGADSFRGDKDWHKFVGGHFITHPRYRTFHVSVTDVKHPITQGIEEFMITDEQYILDYDKENVTVLANALYKGKLMPALWTKSHGKGRVFYTGMGHDPKATKQPMFLKIFLRACQWAVGREVKD